MDNAGQKLQADLGCATILLSPIVAFGALLLANASSDSRTAVEVVMSSALWIIALTMFVGGGVVWLRHR